MHLIKLALKNIRGNGFRNLAIFLAVMGVAGFLLATTLIIKGAEYSLDSIEAPGRRYPAVRLGENKVETASRWVNLLRYGCRQYAKNFSHSGLCNRFLLRSI
jgi:hypothetical protein